MREILFLIIISLFCSTCYANKNVPLPESAKRLILMWEGKAYTNDPRDAGGPTKYGWTLKTWKATFDKDATESTIKNITENQAMDAYEKEFWHRYGAQYISDHQLAETVLLAQINLGYYRPNRLLQTLCNDYCDSRLPLNGKLDKQTVHSINNCKAVQIAFPYVLFSGTYMKFKSIDWAKKGLRSRVMHHTKDDRGF